MSHVTQLKISKHFNKHFTKEIYRGPKSTGKMCSITQKSADYNHSGKPPHTYRILELQHLTIASIGKGVEHMEFLYVADGNVK